MLQPLTFDLDLWPSGDLRDDSNPEFCKEFYRALSVVCDDLFFSRYRRESASVASLAENTGDYKVNKLLYIPPTYINTLYTVRFKPKGVYKWLVDRSLCLEADDI